MESVQESCSWLERIRSRIQAGKSTVEENNALVTHLFIEGYFDKEIYDTYFAGLFVDKILHSAVVLSRIELSRRQLD